VTALLAAMSATVLYVSAAAVAVPETTCGDVFLDTRIVRVVHAAERNPACPIDEDIIRHELCHLWAYDVRGEAGWRAAVSEWGDPHRDPLFLACNAGNPLA
jgi:hypothetical protein